MGKKGDCGCGKPARRHAAEEHIHELPIDGPASLIDLPLSPGFRSAFRFLLEDVPDISRTAPPVEVVEAFPTVETGVDGSVAPRYLTGAFVDLSGVEHMTPGLRVFEGVPLNGFVGNCFECETRSVVVCLRFFLVDVCGGARRTEEAPGILRGVMYPAYKGAAHLGRLTDKTIAMVDTLVAGVNKIWGQCAANQIQFRIAKNADDTDKPFIYAFDPSGVPAEYVNKEKWPFELVNAGRTVYLEVVHTQSIDLCQLLVGRDITTKNGGKDLSARQEVAYGKNSYSGLPSIEELKAQQKEEYKESAKPTITLENRAVLSIFGKAVDGKHRTSCINCFVVGEFEDTGESGEEGGSGEEPGRNMFLDETVVSGNRSRTLAHELGHNLGLKHEDDEDNLMHKSSGGTGLREGDDDDQCKPAFAQSLKTPGSVKVEKGF